MTLMISLFNQDAHFRCVSMSQHGQYLRSDAGIQTLLIYAISYICVQAHGQGVTVQNTAESKGSTQEQTVQVKESLLVEFTGRQTRSKGARQRRNTNSTGLVKKTGSGAGKHWRL